MPYPSNTDYRHLINQQPLKDELLFISNHYWLMAKKLAEIEPMWAKLHFGLSTSFCQYLNKIPAQRLRILAEQQILHFRPRCSEKELMQILTAGQPDCELMVTKSLIRMLDHLKQEDVCGEVS